MPILKMKTERVILSFIAVLVGILVTGTVFYLYQSTKKPTTQNTKTITILEPAPTPAQNVFLTINTPSDEIVISKKIVSITGTTEKDATVVIVTPVDQVVLTPASSGNFSTTVNIDDGENFVEITAISAKGQETKMTRTVTFSTEDF